MKTSALPAAWYALLAAAIFGPICLVPAGQDLLAEDDVAQQPAADSTTSSTQEKAGDKSASDKQAERHAFTVLATDDEGRPVEGAWVGYFGGFLLKRSPDWLFLSVLEKSKWQGLKSDAQGKCQLFIEDMVRNPSALIALSVPRQLVGIKIVARNDLFKAAQAEQAVEIVMQPACHVQGKAASTGLKKLKQDFEYFGASVSQDGLPLFEHDSGPNEFEFYLPPGTFTIQASARFCHFAKKTVNIEPGQRSLAMTLDLPPTKFVKLIGQPAPELRDVVAWKNSKPLKLAELRGKYVLLDFWGYWCGPCVRDMPRLFAWHERFSGHGLTIIGIHFDPDNSVNTPEKLDAALEEVRRDIWQGRDVPYPVALVAANKTKYEGVDEFARSAVSADFGVLFYPTYILIDPQGRVVNTIDATEEDEKMLAKLLRAGD